MKRPTAARLGWQPVIGEDLAIGCCAGLSSGSPNPPSSNRSGPGTGKAGMYILLCNEETIVWRHCTAILAAPGTHGYHPADNESPPKTASAGNMNTVAGGLSGAPRAAGILINGGQSLTIQGLFSAVLINPCLAIEAGGAGSARLPHAAS